MKRWLFPDDIEVDSLALLVDLSESERVPHVLRPPGVSLAGFIDAPPGDLPARRITRVHRRDDLPFAEEADALKVSGMAAFDLLLLREIGKLGKPLCLDVSYLSLKDIVRALESIGPESPVCLLHALDVVGAVKRMCAFGGRFELPIGYIVRGPTDDALLERAVASMGAQDFTLLQITPSLIDHIVAYVPSLLADHLSLRYEARIRGPVVVVARSLKAGETLTMKHLRYEARQTRVVYRPSPEVVLGKPARRDLEAGELLCLTDVRLHVAGMIQVRMRSSRLPGKALMPLGSQSALEHVIDRAKLAETLDSVIICTTDRPEDAELVQTGERKGVPTFRGSEMNVIKRFLDAAEEHGADVMVRITGDSPLVDPRNIDEAVRHHLETNADYTYCVGLPVGTAVEVFNTAALRLAYRLSEDPDVSEDLTLYLRRPEVFNVSRWEPPRERHAPELVMALNRPEDAEVIRAIFEALERPGEPPFSAEEAIQWLRAHPEIAAINSDYIPKPTVCNTRFVYSNLR